MRISLEGQGTGPLIPRRGGVLSRYGEVIGRLIYVWIKKDIRISGNLCFGETYTRTLGYYGLQYGNGKRQESIPVQPMEETSY